MPRPLPPPFYMTRRIAVATANYFRCSVDDLKSDSRVHELVVPRMMAVMLVRERTKRTFPQIGLYFNRDHTTCIHAFYQIKRRMVENAHLRQFYDDLTALIDGTVDHLEASLPRFRQLYVRQQQGVGEGSQPDFGVQELEADGGPYAECPAPPETSGALPDQYPAG